MCTQPPGSYKLIILHYTLAEIDAKSHHGMSVEGSSSMTVIHKPISNVTNTSKIEKRSLRIKSAKQNNTVIQQHISNASNANVIEEKTVRIESAERNELLNQLIKEKVTSVHNGMLCLLCGKIIRQNSNIRRHFRDRHLHEGVHYNCPQCQKTYKSRNTFSSHISMMHRDWGKVDLHNFATPASTEY